MPPPDTSRDALVRTMRRLLRRQGYAATGLKQVLTESGVTTGSLYHHFPGGKEALAEAALIASGRSVGAGFARLLDSADSPAAGVAAWVELAIEAMAGNPTDGCPVTPAACESVHASAALRRAAAGAFAHWCEVLAARLHRDGWAPAPAAEAATAVVALLEGAWLLARTAGDPAALRAASKAAALLLPRTEADIPCSDEHRWG